MTANQSHSATPKPSYRSDVQGLRAIAVTIVVLYHAGLALPGGFVGVDVFFVLSGFVIMRGLLYELESSGRIDLGAFTRRRIRRLLPALALLLAVVVPLGLLFAPVDGFRNGIRTAISASLFNANNSLSFDQESYFGASTELNPLLHTWSLSVEEQFYLVFPGFLLVSWLIAKRIGVDGRKALVVALSVGSLVSLAASILIVEGIVGFDVSTPFGVLPVNESFAFFSAPTRAWEFAVGALLAFGAARLPLNKTLLRGAAFGGVGLLVFSSLAYSEATAFPGVAAAVPVVATVLLLLGGGDGPLKGFLDNPVLQRLGDLSYGWYLWHWPMIVFVGAATVSTPFESPWVLAAAGFVALVPAHISMRLVENPIRHSRRFTPRATLYVGAACIMVPLVIALASTTIWDRVHADTLERVDTAVGVHLDVDLGCDRSTNPQPPDRDEQCLFVADEPAGVAVLVGDSNAGHFAEGAVLGLGGADYTVQVNTLSSCLFADVEMFLRGNFGQRCAGFVADTTEELVASRPDLVLIGHAADIYINDPEFGARAPSGEVVTSVDDKLEVLTQGLARTVRTLREAGIEVVVLQPVPRLGEWDPGACSITRWGADRPNCDAVVAPDDLAMQREQMAQLGVPLVAEGARLVDVSGQWCDELSCETQVGDTFVFRDATHISVAASESLAGVFRSIVSDTDEPAALPFAE